MTTKYTDRQLAVRLHNSITPKQVLQNLSANDTICGHYPELTGELIANLSDAREVPKIDWLAWCRSTKKEKKGSKRK
jgi:hypothetical protein